MRGSAWGAGLRVYRHLECVLRHPSKHTSHAHVGHQMKKRILKGKCQKLVARTLLPLSPPHQHGGQGSVGRGNGRRWRWAVPDGVLQGVGGGEVLAPLCGPAWVDDSTLPAKTE